jgi:hypothetical protein
MYQFDNHVDIRPRILEISTHLSYIRLDTKYLFFPIDPFPRGVQRWFSPSLPCDTDFIDLIVFERDK